MSLVAGRHFGGATAAVGGAGAGFDAVLCTQRGNRLGRFVGDTYAATASAPDGYGMQSVVPPRTAGSMAALCGALKFSEGASDLLQGGAIQGTAALLSVGSAGGLALVVSLVATTAVATLSGGGAPLQLTMALNGSAAVAALSGAGDVSMRVPCAGTGTVAALSGAADLLGRLELAGEWTPFTDLSPQGLASAVLSSTVEGPLTLEQVLRVLLAHAAGEATGLDGSAVFKSQDRTKDRIVGTISGGTRTITSVDGS